LEVVVTSAILAILLGGMASAVMLAGRAMPDGKSGPSASLAAGRAADRIAADLFYATSIATANAREIVFTVADRNGDGSPETIRYYWSGTSGDPLTRQFNGATAAVVAQDVREFQLAYDKRQVALPVTYSDGVETLLATYGGFFFLDDGNINSTSWRGQYFQPTLPANAKSWKVTRVRFKARKHGPAAGDTKVQLRPANGTVPGDFVIDERSMSESSLGGSSQWVEFAFSNASGMLPGSGMCLVLAGTRSADTCDVRYQSLLAWPSNSQWVVSNNGGASWTAPEGQSMVFSVYGTVSTPNPVGYEYRLASVRCTLRSGPNTWSRSQTSIRVVNEPQVAGP
jgi:hypothetical protein